MLVSSNLAEERSQRERERGGKGDIKRRKKQESNSKSNEGNETRNFDEHKHHAYHVPEHWRREGYSTHLNEMDCNFGCDIIITSNVEGEF